MHKLVELEQPQHKWAIYKRKICSRAYLCFLASIFFMADNMTAQQFGNQRVKDQRAQNYLKMLAIVSFLKNKALILTSCLPAES
jgi:hypothetical protein